MADTSPPAGRSDPAGQAPPDPIHTTPPSPPGPDETRRGVGSTNPHDDVALDAGLIAEVKARAAFFDSLASTNTVVRTLIVELGRKHAGERSGFAYLPSMSENALGSRPVKQSNPDGPFESDGFRFAGVEVRFGTATKQYKLVSALWDDEKQQLSAARLVEDVVSEVYGEDNDTQDATFRQLCSDTRKRLQAANCHLDIRLANGKVQLSRV